MPRKDHKQANPDLPRVKPTATLSDRAKEIRNAKHAAGPGLPFRAGDPGRVRADNARLAHDRQAMIAWSAQEKADIEAGRKKAPLTSKEKEMATPKKPAWAPKSGDPGLWSVDKKHGEGKPLSYQMSEAEPGKQFKDVTPKPLKTALVRETEASGSRKDLASKIRETRASKLPGEQLSDFQQEAKSYIKAQSAAETGEAQAFVGVMKPQAPHVDTQRAEVPKMRERWDQMQKSIAEQRSSVKPMTLKEKKVSKETKTQMAERVYKSQTQTMHSSLAESDLAMVGQSKNPIGEGARDLGRSVTRTIRRGAEGDTELLKLAKSRSKAGLSVAGPGSGEVKKPRWNAKSSNLKAKFGGAAGKLGGKLGAYGMIKGIVEGADTLRKMKSGAYDLTPEGGTKLKKGYTES